MSDDEREFTVVAVKALTATFTVYAEDEDDARFQVETPTGFDYDVTCVDAVTLIADDWNVTDITEKS